jgi:hypothetical protein
VFTLDSLPIIKEERKRKTNFNKYNGSMVQAFCYAYTEFLPSHPFILSLRFLSFYTSRFLIPRPFRVKALSASHSKTKLTGTAANRAAHS